MLIMFEYYLWWLQESDEIRRSVDSWRIYFRSVQFGKSNLTFTNNHHLYCLVLLALYCLWQLHNVTLCCLKTTFTLIVLVAQKRHNYNDNDRTWYYYFAHIQTDLVHQYNQSCITINKKCNMWRHLFKYII